MERRDGHTCPAEHWRSYAGLAAAFLAVNQQADAQVICTDLNPDVVLVNDTLEIDFDQDGITDVAIRHFGQPGVGYAFADGEVWGAVISGPWNSESVGAYALPLGAWIHAQTGYWPVPGGWGLLANATGVGEWHGQTAYLGCRFQDTGLPPGNRHYAYVHLSLDSINSNIITVLDYAYESTPNMGISAGSGCIVSVADHELEGFIQLFPNPVQDLTKVRFGEGLEGLVNVQVLDGIGRVLQQHSTTIAASRCMTLDLSDLPAGTYFIAVQNNKRVLHRTATKVE